MVPKTTELRNQTYQENLYLSDLTLTFAVNMILYKGISYLQFFYNFGGKMKTLFSVITLVSLTILEFLFADLIPKWIYMTILSWYILIPIGIFLPLFVFGVFIAYSLQNKPFTMIDGKATKSDFGFFTALLPGQVKIIIRGGSFIRPIMKTDGYTFKGLVDPSVSKDNPSEYWEIVEIGKLDTNLKKNVVSAYPVSSPNDSFWLNIFFITYRYPWWLWKRFILRFTGLVFTGIWPFQTVKIYPIRYFRETTDDSGRKTLVEQNNYSDHYRLKPFDFIVPIESSDTKDFVPVKLTITFQGRISNPYDVVTSTDGGNWSLRVFNHLPSKVNDYTRNREFKDVLTGEETGLIDTINKLGADDGIRGNKDSLFGQFGLRIANAATPDRSMKTTGLTPEEKRFLEKSLSKVDAEVLVNLAQGAAEAMGIQITAIKEGGDIGTLVAQLKRDVDVATLVKDNTNAIVTIGTGGSNTNDEQLVILKSILSKLSGAEINK